MNSKHSNLMKFFNLSSGASLLSVPRGKLFETYVHRHILSKAGTFSLQELNLDIKQGACHWCCTGNTKLVTWDDSPVRVFKSEEESINIVNEPSDQYMIPFSQSFETWDSARSRQKLLFQITVQHGHLVSLDGLLVGSKLFANSEIGLVFVIPNDETLIDFLPGGIPYNRF